MAKTTTSNTPGVGKSAPAFTLPTADGEKVRLSEFKGDKNVVVYFYPKDNTPGCTKQACAFQKDLTKYKRRDTVVIGISPDGAASHEKFADKFGLKFYLLSDEDKKIAEKYGVWVEKSLYGRKFMGVQRATFLVDKRGKVAAAWPKVKVAGHSDEVLAAIAELD